MLFFEKPGMYGGVMVKRIPERHLFLAGIDNAIHCKSQQ
jgi:hypothetical protein